jgi:hypothetical protein
MQHEIQFLLLFLINSYFNQIEPFIIAFNDLVIYPPSLSILFI